VLFFLNFLCCLIMNGGSSPFSSSFSYTIPFLFFFSPLLSFYQIFDFCDFPLFFVFAIFVLLVFLFLPSFFRSFFFFVFYGFHKNSSSASSKNSLKLTRGSDKSNHFSEMFSFFPFVLFNRSICKNEKLNLKKCFLNFTTKEKC
jgi:hypothetical protein